MIARFSPGLLGPSEPTPALDAHVAHLPVDLIPAVVIFPPLDAAEATAAPPARRGDVDSGAATQPITDAVTDSVTDSVTHAVTDAVTAAPLGSAGATVAGDRDLGSGLRPLLKELRVGAMRREIPFEQQARPDVTLLLGRHIAARRHITTPRSSSFDSVTCALIARALPTDVTTVTWQALLTADGTKVRERRHTAWLAEEGIGALAYR